MAFASKATRLVQWRVVRYSRTWSDQGAALESVLTLSAAKARFSEIVEKVVNGDEVIVTRMGRPVVRISRFAAAQAPAKLGDLAGQIHISDDFDDWPADLQEALGIAERE